MSAKQINAPVAQIKPVLAGHEPAIQGAALADLLAIWLASHVVSGDREATAGLREELLAFHIAHVRELIPINAKAIGTAA